MGNDSDVLTKKTRLIIDITNRIGFPIIACAALWWLCNETIKENTKAIGEIKETIQVGFGEVKDALKDQNRILRRSLGSGDIAYDTKREKG